MKAVVPLRGFSPILLAFFLSLVRVFGEGFPLTLSSTGAGVELAWPAGMSNAAPGVVLPEYEVQFSTDLKSWKPLGGKVRGIQGLSDTWLKLSLSRQDLPIFYRVLGDTNSSAANETGAGGAQVFGYNSEFSQRLAQLGQLSVDDFATNSGNISYLPQLTWDPTTAEYWTNFSSTTVWYDNYGALGVTTSIPYNYLLDTNELGLFRTNGFVVSGRLGSPSFGDAYYRIFNADLPLFISADSILHAWHRSYQSMLEEVEELQLSTMLERVLSNTSLQLPNTWQQYGQGSLSNSILDADYFLTVARSLWSSQQVASVLGVVDAQVAATLTAINSQIVTDHFPIFGAERGMDFSQFVVRGHYADSDRLARYFRTMMWCGRTDLRLATFWPNQEDDIRQLGTAVVLNDLLNQSGQLGNWSVIEQITRTFVGTTDSMTFPQLNDLLASANIRSLADGPDLFTLTNLQTRLLTGELGVQSIHSDFLYSPYSPELVKLPRSFTFCGQKFIMDSWVFSQVVFDRVQWSPDYGTNIIFGKVIRRKPSCLDAAFAVFGNNQVVPELVARMTNDNGVPFRDGPHLPYQHNLLATRQAIDDQDPAVWTNNIYNAWLGTLRALSSPTTDLSYPESMRTRAWAMKTLNTQLASWTELRHDTLLYAKQSYTEPILCDYPAGFVEPRPEFWQQMKTMSEIAAKALAGLPLTGKVTLLSHGPLPGNPVSYDLLTVQSNQVRFLTNFASQVATLEAMSRKELAQEPFTIEEFDFLKNTIELVRTYASYRQWDGWYPKLFYTNVFFPGIWAVPPCDLWDAMVADVHTDLPDQVVQDPGAVIHEGIANVNLLLIAVDNGPNRMVYAGPVLSHYEFEVPGVNRMTDSQWKTNVLSGQIPSPPDWTKSYLVPGTIPIPAGYQ